MSDREMEDDGRADQYGKLLHELRSLSDQVSKLHVAISGDMEVGHTGLAEQIRLNTRRIKTLHRTLDSEIDSIKDQVNQNFEKVSDDLQIVTMKTESVVRQTNTKLGIVGVIGGLAGTAITILISWFRSLDL